MQEWIFLDGESLFKATVLVASNSDGRGDCGSSDGTVDSCDDEGSSQLNAPESLGKEKEVHALDDGGCGCGDGDCSSDGGIALLGVLFLFLGSPHLYIRSIASSKGQENVCLCSFDAATSNDFFAKSPMS